MPTGPHPESPPDPPGHGDSPLAETIADLQTRLAYQDDEIVHLNRVVEDQRVALARHAAQIEQLQRIVTALAESLREPTPDAPPPHY